MKSKLSRTLVGVLLALAITSLFPSLGSACVFVNGQQLSDQQILEAERLHGGKISCGWYLFDANTGAWWDVNRSRGGYLGNSQYQRGGGASGEYSVDSYAGGYVGGKGDCATIYIPSSNYTYLGDGC